MKSAVLRAYASPVLACISPYLVVQVRNRLWRIEAASIKGETNAPKRIIECMSAWVPQGSPVGIVVVIVVAVEQ